MRRHVIAPRLTTGVFLIILILITIFVFSEDVMSRQISRSEPKGSPRPDSLGIIPEPMETVPGEGIFILKSDSKIIAGFGTQPEARYLADALAPATGFSLEVTEDDNNTESNFIYLKLDPTLVALGDEGYHLRVQKDRIEAAAAKPAGIFYACQTLRQLLPVEIFSDSQVDGIEWSIPCVSIKDKPRFEWRGHLFDCCRHFFDKETVKRAIDLLALHKMNRLHWHLTEDQGWRIEIMRYPKLTEIGAWRIEKDGSRYGGYYSQEDIREIVAYAASRHVTVVPEVELPGHSTAALASYPELGCSGGPYEVANRWGVFRDVYCVGKEETFTFLENVLDEVMMLFPSPYIHIGGDECPKERWKECPKCQARIKTENLKDEHELQSYFIKRIDAYLTSKGRRLIGWDEILEGGLAPGAIVQSWRGIKGGIEAAGQGHDVIMSPTSHCYLDYSYATTPLEESYSFEPIPDELSSDKAHHVIGLEGNMWTEWVPTRDRYDFQVYPRLTALSEVAWSPEDKRDWKDFKKRMTRHYKRLEIIGVKYGKDELGASIKGSTLVGDWRPDRMSEEGVTLEWDVSKMIDDAGVYEAIFLYTAGSSAIQLEWVALLENGKEIHRDTHTGWSGHDKRNIVYKLELESRKPDAVYTIRANLASVGGTDSKGEVRLKKESQ